jgi:hypothetical protein
MVPSWSGAKPAETLFKIHASRIETTMVAVPAAKEAHSLLPARSPQSRDNARSR